MYIFSVLILVNTRGKSSKQGTRSHRQSYFRMTMKQKLPLFLINFLFSIAAFATQTATELKPVNGSEKPSTAPSFNTEPVSKDEFYRQ
jgi:hypothetical protein